MDDVKLTHYNEIDFFDVIDELWLGKWFIFSFVLAVVSCVGVFFSFQEPIYESKIKYSVYSIPPFYDKDKVLLDFRNTFYSNNVFEKWKEKNKSALIVFDDFSESEVVDGFLISKNEAKRKATLSNKNLIDPFVTIKTNKFGLLDDFYNYSNHVNDFLRSEYVFRAKNEIKFIETRFQNLSMINNSFIENILDIDRYISSVEKGLDVVLIQRPQMPEKVYPNTPMILTLSLALSSVLGMLIVLMRNAFRKRNTELTKL